MMHHEFAHAAVRGAGYAAGRMAVHEMGGLALLLLVVCVAIAATAGKRP